MGYLISLSRISFLLALCCGLMPAQAASAADEEAAICDHAARHGAETGDVPLDVLRALTRTETGRSRNGQLRPWPWTVNMEGEGFWFDTRDEALAFVLARHAAGARSFDVGCFQINYRWHGEQFDSIEAMFDPLENARYAARFIGSLKAEGRDWTGAAGAYHSRTPSFASKYRNRFTRILAALDAPPTGRMAKTRAVSAKATPVVRPIIGGESVRGGLYVAPPAHTDPASGRRNWRGGVPLNFFADDEIHLLTIARPLFE